MIPDLTPEERHARGRLWRIELDRLHASVAEDVLHYLSRWAVPLAPGALGLPRPADAAYTDIAYTIRYLVAYARRGRVADWDSADDALDALNSVSLLYAAPYGDPVIPADWSSETERAGARGDLAEVAGAVLARVQIEQRRPVPRAWLAALAGVSVKSVVKAISQGDLRSVKRKRAARGDGGGRRSVDVEVESARAWLVARGVEGVGETQKAPTEAGAG